jgi:hypothetical protein
MNVTAGTGALLRRGDEVPVAYDLVRHDAGERFTAEGQVFGDADALRDVYLSGACLLRLESGGVAKIVLLDCKFNGAADVRVIGRMRWD